MGDYVLPNGTVTNFSTWELECHCGCKSIEMDTTFMGRVQAYRMVDGRAMSLSSAFRCSIHNSNISSTGSKGPHTQGKAIDILCYGERYNKLLSLALSFNFTGIGSHQKGNHAKRFIHIDDVVRYYPNSKNIKPLTMWTY